MDVEMIPLRQIQVSSLNTRKDIDDGQEDATLEELSRSIKEHGLLNPITVQKNTTSGKYEVIAGQRRYLACKHANLKEMPAVVRDDLSDAQSITLSLLENVHRADMNPIDKARAFQELRNESTSLKELSKKIHVGTQTIQKYLQLLALSPRLQRLLAAGEAKNTQALAMLGTRVPNHENQVKVWLKINGFTQSVQMSILRKLQPNIENLEELVEAALEGIFNRKKVEECPKDCPNIPSSLKEQFIEMMEKHRSAS